MAKVQVVPCSSQRGKSRYSCREPESIPGVAEYRNNLTALSQYNNLLFVAYLDKVHVFEPGFPHQTLSKDPSLIIDLPKSRAARRGYLDLTCPHAVNHLIVGDLGNEEIFLAACDDGDIISYTLRSIILAMEWVVATNSDAQRTQAAVDGPPSWGCTAPKPWFLENVGHSAWGLAIHKEARFLAVSSNTQAIDVFAPALRKLDACRKDPPLVEDQKLMDEELMWDGIWKISTGCPPSDRFCNRRVRLIGHTCNVPNITFAGVHKQGRYLASTDIEENTFIWDIYSGSTVFQSRAHTSQSSRGWGVVCLDPLKSRMTSGAQETFGCDDLADGKGSAIDISQGSHFVLDNSHWHPAFAKFGAVSGTNPHELLAMIAQPVAALESDEPLTEADDESVEEDVDHDEGESEAEQEVADTVADPEELPDSHPETVEQYAAPGEVQALFNSLPQPEAAPTDLEMLHESYAPTDNYAIEDGDDVHIEDLMDLDTAIDFQLTTGQTHWQIPLSMPVSPRRTANKRPKAKLVNRKGASIGKLPFNLLQTSENDICLYRDIRCVASTNVPEYTRVVSQQALHQKLPPGLYQLGHIERLNMIAQIPELGIVIIGNQVGRVGILTATRWQASQQSGYTIDCIVPFKSQEEQGLRPQKALMGMAVGPLQGHEYQPDPGMTQAPSQDAGPAGRPLSLGPSRKFRLLLMYCDHTVLSYEISRQSGDEIVVI